MKELTIEQKAKAYDEAIERYKAKQEYESQKVHEFMEYIFPELKENEDEKIRKTLMQNLKERFGTKGNMGEGLDMPNILAWFERQGEHTNFLSKIQVGDKVTRNEDGELVNLSQLNRVAKSADKVEPKFHEGEWVVNTLGDLWYINSFDDKNYQVSDGKGNCNYFPISKQDEMYHWAIQNVKNGDVLCYKDEISLYKHDIKNCTKQEKTFGGFVYYCCYDGKRLIMNSLYSLTEQDKIDIHPATKEQRDTLMKAMADAGWEFDFEKKELKKIEQKPADSYCQENCKGFRETGKCFADWECKAKREAEQKSAAWCEEDETRLTNILIMLKEGASHHFVKDDITKAVDWLKSFKDRVQPKQKWNYNDGIIIETIIQEIEKIPSEKFIDNAKNRCLDWLRYRTKSLRPQNAWKPSEEQLRELENVFSPNTDSWDEDILRELYEQLKQL